MNSFPPEIEQFVREELARGGYADESDLVVHALEIYRELKTRHDELRADIEQAIVAADRGEVAPLDIEAIKAEIATAISEPGKSP